MIKNIILRTTPRVCAEKAAIVRLSGRQQLLTINRWNNIFVKEEEKGHLQSTIEILHHISELLLYLNLIQVGFFSLSDNLPNAGGGGAVTLDATDILIGDKIFDR